MSRRTRPSPVARPTTDDPLDRDLLAHLLPYEKRIAQLSQRFLGIGHADLDEAIGDGLRAVGELAGADRANLLLFDEHGSPASMHRWCADDADYPPPPSDPGVALRFRWSTRRALRGETIRIERLSDLPVEAHAEREDFERRGVRSFVGLAVRARDRVAAYLSFECVHQARSWSEQQIRLLRVAGEILAAAIERSEAIGALRASEHALEMQLEVEQRIAELSRRFLDLRGEDFEEAARGGLRLVAEVARAERSYLVLFDPEPPYLVGIHEWCCEGVEPYGHRIAERDNDTFRWSSRIIASGEILRIPSPEAIPSEGAAERRDLEERGVRSLLGVPVHSEGAMIGYLGIEYLRESRHWSDIEVTRLRLMAEIFASALRRRRAEAILARQREIERRIAHLSREFIDLSGEQIDEGIQRGLEVAASVARADLAFLVRIDAQAGATEHHEWRREGIVGPSDALRGNPREGFPWALGQIRERGWLEVPSVPRLPEEAALERDDLLRRGVRSVLGFPVLREDRLSGYLGLECHHRERRWSEDELTLLHILRELFASGLRRKQAEEDLARQLEAEQRIAELSQHFLALGPGEIPAAVERAVEEMAKLAGSDRAVLALGGGTTGGEQRVFEWCAENYASASLSEAPWIVAELLRGEVVHIPSTTALPAAAVRERVDFERRGVGSLLGLPVASSGTVIGTLSLESRSARNWSEREVTILRLASDLFASAFRRQDAEQALRDSQIQLLEAQKMDAVGRLAGGVAHDFNNLLMVISGHSEMMISDLDEDDPLRRDAREIHEAAARAASLTRRLLAFSRPQLVTRKRLDLNRVVSGMEDMLRRLLGEDIELSIQLSPEPAVVEGDAHQLEQVLLNLAVNGRDAMPEGGRLTILTGMRVVSGDEARRLGLPCQGEYASLVVEDTGAGMDEPTRIRVFEPFFTTKEPGKGTGLGLSIAYGVVKQSGGAIAIESALGVGTGIEIFLPPLSGDVDAEEARSREQTAQGSGTVLLVEDERAVRNLVQRLLAKSGYRVLAAEDAEDALALHAEHPGSIDVLVTDVVMPKLSGGELARRLRAEQPDLSVVFVSGYARERQHSSSGGPLPPGEFLQKPFSTEGLLEAVERACRKAPKAPRSEPQASEVE